MFSLMEQKITTDRMVGNLMNTSLRKLFWITYSKSLEDKDDYGRYTAVMSF